MRRVALTPGDSMGLRSLTGRILPRTFYERGTEQVARDLLGAVIVSRIDNAMAAGRIVEVEAYLGPSDAASHAVAGRTERTWHLFGRPGSAYVYFTYGMHWCVNAVAGRGGLGGAVLLRAVEPLIGLDVMRRRRGPTAPRDRDLASGPAKLCQALGIDRALDGASLQRGALVIRAGTPVRSAHVVVTPRIGLNPKSAALDWPLRYSVKDSPYRSRP